MTFNILYRIYGKYVIIITCQINAMYLRFNYHNYYIYVNSMRFFCLHLEKKMFVIVRYLANPIF